MMHGQKNIKLCITCFEVDRFQTMHWSQLKEILYLYSIFELGVP